MKGLVLAALAAAFSHGAGFAMDVYDDDFFADRNGEAYMDDYFYSFESAGASHLGLLYLEHIDDPDDREYLGGESTAGGEARAVGDVLSEIARLNETVRRLSYTVDQVLTQSLAMERGYFCVGGAFAIAWFGLATCLACLPRILLRQRPPEAVPIVEPIQITVSGKS